MKPAKVNITVYQGATFRKKFFWYTQDSDTTLPVNLTGYTFACQARRHISDVDTLFSLTSGQGVVVEPLLGAFSIELTADQTREISFRTGLYDIEATAPSGAVYRLVEGRIELSLEVTR